MSQSSPWAILLCRFKDTNEVNIPLGRVNSLFTAVGAGTFNMPRYLYDMSHGQIDLSGSQVFPQAGPYFKVEAFLHDYVPPAEPPPINWTQRSTPNARLPPEASALSDSACGKERQQLPGNSAGP